jgi:hypothetical protein
MTSILDVTGDDIATLNDADLRTLVGLLCESKIPQPVAGVGEGAAQDVARCLTHPS